VVLEQAVADGTLTQEQADMLSQGPMGHMGPGGPHPRGERPPVED
jgi:hypothetical protein